MSTIFSVQDETGTVTQLTLLPSPLPAGDVAVGDIGLYEGIPDDGTTTETFQSLLFTVSQIVNATQFSIHTENANMADWPANGVITWQTGANATEQSTVISIDGANAYINIPFFQLYHASRGNNVGTPTDGAIQAAIVQATDYLDQKYRYSGVKKLQTLGSSAAMAANAIVFQSWLYPYSLSSANYLTPSTSKQSTQWPRQGVVDLSGNTVNGIPEAIKGACAQLALRVLSGTNLQPDYDPGLVGNGGVVSQITKKIGPLETSISYDVRQGLGFFASFPQIDRMLSKAGLLYSGGGRSVVR